MYEKPTVERFGSFRELTLLGHRSGNDLSFLGIDSGGCTVFCGGGEGRSS